MVIYIGYHRTKGDNMKKYAIILLFILSILICSCMSAGDSFVTIDTGEVTHVTEPPKETETEEPRDTEITSAPIEITTPEEMLVTINEICPLNKGCFRDSDGSTPDWIELYNCSDKTINLAGYGISDDISAPFKYTFNNYLIKSGDCILLIASGETDYKRGVIYLPFTIPEEGGTVILTSPHGTTDVIELPDMSPDEAYGRTADGGNVLSHLTPSPLVTNNSAESLIRVSAPTFSHKSGFYTEDIEITISATEGCTVYYTLDGSLPTADSPVYTGPVALSDATAETSPAIGEGEAKDFAAQDDQDNINVLRAVALDEDGNASKVVNATYFIMPGEKPSAYKNVSILSLYTDPEHLIAPDCEKAAAIDYFDETQSFCFSQDVRISIKGNTRFEIYAENKYEKIGFDYPLFSASNSCDSLIITPFIGDESGTKILDLAVQALLSGTDDYTQEWKPCALFLNGEYWGFYIIEELCDSDYISAEYGTQKDDIVIINGDLSLNTEDDIALYDELVSFIIHNDMTIRENYGTLLEMVDIESYIDYICLALMTDAHGEPTLWRKRTVDESTPYADGRWRWEYSNLEHTSEADHTCNTYSNILKDDILFTHVYKNPDFASEFHVSLGEMLEYSLNSALVDDFLAYLGENFDTQMNLHYLRYGFPENFPAILDCVREFLLYRAEYLALYTNQLFSLN
ncbi:MAG: hypothetical protein E7671_04055 [Ruminococcaceae bacterium]|nr:hypothetical protein [Oscillospiraceae bacterium]